MLASVKPILRAAAIAAFVVGTVLLLVDPPSLSGAGRLAAIGAGAVALVALTAWATVALRGREELSEREFERVVERAEILGGAGAPGHAPTDFERIVGEAIERLPDEFRRLV